VAEVPENIILGMLIVSGSLCNHQEGFRVLRICGFVMGTLLQEQRYWNNDYIVVMVKTCGAARKMGYQTIHFEENMYLF